VFKRKIWHDGSFDATKWNRWNRWIVDNINPSSHKIAFPATAKDKTTNVYRKSFILSKKSLVRIADTKIIPLEPLVNRWVFFHHHIRQYEWLWCFNVISSSAPLNTFLNASTALFFFPLIKASFLFSLFQLQN